MKTKRYRTAGGVVYQQGVIEGLDRHQQYFLLLDRPARNEIRLPKGHVDEGETVIEAARRETAEESGYVDLEIAGDLGDREVEFDYDGAHYVRSERYFLMQLRSSRRIPRNEVDAAQFNVRWVPSYQAAELLTYEAEQERILQALQMLAAHAREAS